MENTILDWKEYSKTARMAAAEGCVLLRNEDQALPIRSWERVSVFGRVQFDYYKSGTGSGGKVNVPYVHSILDGLSALGISVYEPLLNIYRDWVKEHPFDNGTGWGTEPWCQVEMPLTSDQITDAAAHSDLALIILGRTAGEDRDNSDSKGSMYLSDAEEAMVSMVCSIFTRTVVLLNVGNIIDMSWVENYRPQAVLYAWQGGMEGGLAAADVLTGVVNPCGRLSDTIAKTFSEYPSWKNFGSETENFYQEDIYVGYRYFETFCPDKVRYPFGFGLSYTDFSCTASCTWSEDQIQVEADITNTGHIAGKEVLQVYIQAPQGKLGKPLRQLISFAKTQILAPGSAEHFSLQISGQVFASFDDSGCTGHVNCFVLEPGTYQVYAGCNVQDALSCGSFTLEKLLVTEKLQEALAPEKSFSRLIPLSSGNDTYIEGLQEVPTAAATPWEHARQNPLPPASRKNTEKTILLTEVARQEAALSDFLSQLSDKELLQLVKGEGMCSPKATPGVAAAFGGLTEELSRYDIPIACCSDGPSGIRMDCGTTAFSLPNGTALACTFNLPLVRELFTYEGRELRVNQIDTLLGPGINLHRDPRNGRNFEYHSEDPLLTGKMAAAQLQGLAEYGVTGTLKHFACNNQEYARTLSSSNVSARALRELYLRCFEIPVKEGGAYSIMTSYNAINGCWSAGNYDLLTRILRQEWGYNGMVMTDWWASMNDEENRTASRENLASMVKAQNDIYMVVSDTKAHADNLENTFAQGTLTRAELEQSAANILRFLLKSPCMARKLGTAMTIEECHRPKESFLQSPKDLKIYTIQEDTCIPLDWMEHSAGSSTMIRLDFEKIGNYTFTLCASSLEVSEMAQLSVTLTMGGSILHTYTFQGPQIPEGSLQSEKLVRGATHYLNFFFSQNELLPKSLRITRCDS